MDADRMIARHVTGLRYETIPSEVVRVAKERILDTLGVIVAGSAAPGCDKVVDLVRDWGGKRQSTVLVYGDKVPAPHAALANATMGHANDFDDNDDRNAFKGSAATVSAALAVAEYKGGVSGNELILSVCLGLDLGCRMGLALAPRPTSIHRDSNYFGSAMTAAKLLGLDEEQVLNALGLAYCQIAKAPLSTISPALTKRLMAGLSSKGGVFAAMLARKGFVSGRNIFQGEKGYFMQFRGREGNLEELTADLGKRFEVHHCPKPYPSCRFTHHPIDAALSIVREHDLKPDDVEAVNTYLGHRAFTDCGGAEPTVLERKRHPRGVVDAQFSIPYTVAVAIVKRKVKLEDFTEGAVKNPDILRIADKVTPILEPEFDKTSNFITPARVEIRTKDGRSLSKRVDQAKGNSLNPLSADELMEKFRGCIAFASKPLSKKAVEEAITMVNDLETVADVSEIPKLFTSRSKG